MKMFLKYYLVVKKLDIKYSVIGSISIFNVCQLRFYAPYFLFNYTMANYANDLKIKKLQ